MLNLDQVVFFYIPEKILFNHINITIDLKSCTDLRGQNRCGKSTFIKLLMGSLNPLNGKSTIDPQEKVIISDSIS